LDSFEKQLADFINIKDIPLLPEAARLAISKTLSIEKSADEIAAIIKENPSLTLKILKLANSPVYSRGIRLTGIKEAIILLGYKTVKSLILSISIKDMFSDDKSPWFHYKAFWLHSIAVGVISQELSKTLTMGSEDELYSAGLLHDIGKALFLLASKTRYKNVVELVQGQRVTFREAEKKVFGFDHTDVATFLFRYWGIPDTLILLVKNHHSDNDSLISQPDTAAYIVKLANEIAHLGGFITLPAEPPYQASSILIDKLGLVKGDLDRILDHLRNEMETFTEALNIPRSDIKGYFEILSSANNELGKMYLSNQKMMQEITRRKNLCSGLNKISTLFLQEKKMEPAVKSAAHIAIRCFQLDWVSMEIYLNSEKSVLCTAFIPEIAKQSGKTIHENDIEVSERVIQRGRLAADSEEFLFPIRAGNNIEIGKIAVKNKERVDDKDLSLFIDHLALGLSNLRLHSSNMIKTQKLNITIQQLKEECDRRQKLSKLNELILDTSPIGILYIEKEGNILHYNREAENILQERLSGKNLFRLEAFAIYDLRSILASIEKQKKGSKVTVLRNGSYIHLFLQAAPIEATPHILLLINDITERIENEKILIQKEKMATLGELAAGIAHNLRSPLAVIKGVPELILSEVEKQNLHVTRYVDGIETEDSELIENMELIKKSMEKTFAIIDSLMEFAKKESGEFENINLSQIIDEVYRLIEHKLHGKNITFKNNTRTCTLLANKNMITQVFLNLFTNSINAVGDKGTIEVNCKREKGTLIIHFIDDGAGVKEEDLEHIFEPFFTTSGRANGTGIGLSITRRMITLHGGSIKALRRSGGGTVIEIILPDKRRKNE